MAEECQRILNLRHDIAKIEERDIVPVQTVRSEGRKRLKKNKTKQKTIFNLPHVMAAEDFILKQISHSKIKSVPNAEKWGTKSLQIKAKAF